MCNKDKKTSLRIRRYFLNIFRALFGLNPFQGELDEAKKQLETADFNLSDMREQLYSALSKWDESMKALDESNKHAASLQQLIENLRKRVAEKDRLIEQMQKQ